MQVNGFVIFLLTQSCLPWLQVVRDEHRVEPGLLGQDGEVGQLARGELLGRGLISQPERMSRGPGS